MEIKKYQEIIKKTAIYPSPIGLAYCGLGIAGEAGEVADKIKKLYRDKDLLSTRVISNDDRTSIIKELGDVIWYVTAIANELEVPLESVLKMNYDKLIARRRTGTLHGSGDDREQVKGNQ